VLQLKPVIFALSGAGNPLEGEAKVDYFGLLSKMMETTIERLSHRIDGEWKTLFISATVANQWEVSGCTNKIK
jgi:hypothetical protein